MGFGNIKTYFENNYGINETVGVISLVIDIMFVLGLIVLYFIFLKKKMNVWRLIVITAVMLVLYFVSIILDLKIFLGVLKVCGYWFVGFFIILYSQDFKNALEGKQIKDKSEFGFSSEKEKENTINIICDSVEYLASRKIGALITFERKDSLMEFVNKTSSIKLDADITQELITTIFTPGTACHDGAIIIRHNKIASAATYFTLTDNYDIPKTLGTRHRAAIGLSEKNDSVTIVVSEETGYISFVINGKIQINIEIARLRELLNTYLLVN